MTTPEDRYSPWALVTITMFDILDRIGARNYATLAVRSGIDSNSLNAIEGVYNGW